MLRVQTQELAGALVYRLEGRFTGEGAEQVRLLVMRCDGKLELVFDLTDIMFIDSVGEDVLLFAKKLGAAFIAETAYSRDISERLQLPLLHNDTDNSHQSRNSGGNGHHPANGSGWR